jgi:hypothetical protein
MRVGIDVVQPDPGAELAELAGKLDETGADVALLTSARSIFEVDPIGRGVLGDDQDFPHSGTDQLLGLAQRVGERPGGQIAAQLWDNAERAPIIATF